MIQNLTHSLPRSLGPGLAWHSLAGPEEEGGQARPSQLRPAKPGQAQARPRQARPGQAKPGQATKTIQAKPTPSRQNVTPKTDKFPLKLSNAKTTQHLEGGLGKKTLKLRCAKTLPAAPPTARLRCAKTLTSSPLRTQERKEELSRGR